MIYLNWGENMNKKIAFFDIDGTLINVPTGLMEPTKATINALTKFQQQGNLIFIATTRGSVPFTSDDIHFDGFIGNDGHYITLNDEIILDDLFSEEEIQKMMNVFEKNDGRYIFSGHDNSWSTYWEDEYMQKHAQMFQHTTQKPDTLIETYLPKDIHAIACCVLFKNVDDLYQAYEALKDDFTMSVYETGLIRMDVYRKGFTKGTAVKYMYEKLGVSKENTYAFGDGENDMEMLKLVGHGVAMGNAVESLKDVADEITLFVTEDGIADYFEKNIFA